MCVWLFGLDREEFCWSEPGAHFPPTSAEDRQQDSPRTVTPLRASGVRNCLCQARLPTQSATPADLPSFCQNIRCVTYKHECQNTT